MSTTTIPTTMKALVVADRPITFPRTPPSPTYANEALLVLRPVPTPSANELLVKIEFFAANPTDSFHLDYIGPSNAMLGCDFAGVVVSAGSGAKTHKVGDRVLGVVHGGKYPDVGSAAEYCVIADDIAIAIPSNVSSEEAGTFGVGFLTAAAVLYDLQKVALPPAKVEGTPWYFVSGGATSVGLFAVQLAKLAGFRVIASASEHSFELVKSYGADHVVSYADHAAALEEIKKVTSGRVTHALDCIGGDANIKFAVDAFGPAGGPLTTLLVGGKSHREEVKLEGVLLYRYMGKAFDFIPGLMAFPDEPEKRVFLASVNAQASALIEKYNIKANPIEVKKGLEAVPAGWDQLRKKQVKGKKLVFDLRA